MSTFHASDTLWPLCLFRLGGRQSLARHEQMLDIWDGWFARKKPFVALRIYADAASLEQMPGVAKATKAWMKAGASVNIRACVAAMMIVVPPDSLAGLGKMDVERAFGVPGGLFGSEEDALTWLREQDIGQLPAGAELDAAIDSFLETKR